ncbi:MAG: cystathionine gamma-synthase [Schleiferiaceae bacterium]
MNKEMKFGTKAIHGGQSPDPSTGAVMPPIYQTSTYAQARPGEHSGYEYSRTQNPTRHALEKALASIENGTHGLAFGSGLAAVDAVVKLLKPGDEVISTNDLYGGTYRLFTKIFEDFGIVFHFVDMQDVDQVAQKINANTKLIWIETPTNPMLSIIDIQAVAAIAQKNEILVTVDNTFATPYLQNPLDLGADIVLHSATKYLGGHSDVVLGALVVKDADLAEKLYFIQNSSGAVCGPMDSFLVLRGIKTLHVRVDRHCQNGEAVAHYLRKHPKIDKVYWPGFTDHPNHDIAAKQMRNFGGMVSFTVKGDNMEDAFTVVSSMEVFTLAESLGGVESLSGHPASMTHAAIPAEERRKTGVVDSLIRLSVGIEDSEDLIADLEQALAKI